MLRLPPSCSLLRSLLRLGNVVIIVSLQKHRGGATLYSSSFEIMYSPCIHIIALHQQQRIGELKNAYKIFIRKSGENRLLRIQYINVNTIDYIFITNLMHQLLFIHKIIFSSTCFESLKCSTSGYNHIQIFTSIQNYSCY